MSEKMTPAQIFGKNLRKLRLEHGLTQEALATEVDVNIMSIKGWETARYNIRLDNAVRIIEFFGVTMNDMLKGDKEKPK